MKSLYLFNPENDLALACNRRNYSAPRNALELRNSAALLPLWYAGEGDLVLAQGNYDAAWLDEIRDSFGLSANIVTKVEDGMVDRCEPWGWSLAARSNFISVGVQEQRLPTEERIERLRELSHRRTTIAVLTKLKEMGLYPGVIPIELRQPELLHEIMEEFAQDGIFLKSPWSSSGRGVIPSGGKTMENMLTQAAGIIKRQGSVMVEKGYCKVRDFAMLFQKTRGERVKYIGLSLFDTSSQAYTGNILASEQQLMSMLAMDVATEDIEKVRGALTEALNQCIGEYYEGYFGVDMMVVESEGGSRWIHPCVEVNLRMTMGVVSRIFADRYLSPDVMGRFSVSFGEGRVAGSPVIENGLLVQGSVQLVSPGGKFSVTASILPDHSF